MIFGSTFGFVLALCAVALGAAALTISLTTAAALKLLHATSSTTERELAELRKQTPVKLAAEVAELSDAVARLADTHRRFAGKIWAHVGHDHRDGNGASDATDDELSAMLALQKAAPPSR